MIIRVEQKLDRKRVFELAWGQCYKQFDGDFARALKWGWKIHKNELKRMDNEVVYIIDGYRVDIPKRMSKSGFFAWRADFAEGWSGKMNVYGEYSEDKVVLMFTNGYELTHIFS